ncbi:PREDICTED: receptor-type tyrosine-protein phosphatase mu-like, partial [Wasmannia auropunctata]|uniref:receptor-type tyrosine-protein phosphatase mu-like n=1 Tax=Wasmannia auropunctata TaxID=64793 RepID=UPI0005EF8889
MFLNDANCSQGKIGSQCLFSCESDLNSDSNCTGAKICYENGCTCAPGVLGDDCLEFCDTYTYGYGCKKTCGICFDKKQCNIATGVCSKGSDNTDKIIYIPPLCQTNVDKPDIPTIIFVNETTIHASVSIIWKNEYEKFTTLYSFVIQGQIKYGQQSWTKLFRNMTQLTEYFVNLEPGSIYYIGFSLDINGEQIHSNWETVETKSLNSRHFSNYTETIFNTSQSEIPSEIFSQLRVQDWTLSWSPPEDCTTISGSLKTRIKIQGVSDAVKDYNVIKETSYKSLDLAQLSPKLNGVERYLATIYVIRDFLSKENASAYQKYEFETPPTAPPKVTNLEVVEIDTRQLPPMIHLRWQSPRLPLNGKLRNYVVQLCESLCTNITVQLNESCDLWDDYICTIVKKSSTLFQRIKVFAYNINVTEPGLPMSVTEDMQRNTILDAPENYTFTINRNSVIDLKWLHPWRTAGHLEYFRIEIQETSSNLRMRLSRSLTNKTLKYLVTQYMRNYNLRLYLLPSTQYFISIQAVTVENKTSPIKFVEIRTPSTAVFDSILNVMVEKSSSTILLNIPTVSNDTQDSTMHIIVKGSNLCEKHLEVPEKLRLQAGVKMNENAWQAAEVSTSEIAGGQFRMGDNNIYGNAMNCPFKLEEIYEIVIIITERNSPNEPIVFAKLVFVGEVLPKHYEAWLIPVVLIFVVAGAAFYLYRRKMQKLSKQLMQDKMILFQNIEMHERETKSVLSNSKQDPSTNPNKHFLYRATTTEVLPIATANHNEEKKEMTSLIKVKDFEDYVRQAIQSGLLDKQYETFPRGQTRSSNYDDKTRVILKKFPDDAHSDYINANYITGYKKEKQYIATQGPKSTTVIDFWRMIWQENVLIICMLANVVENGKIKCEQYWPDIGKTMKYGAIIVLNKRHNVFADYCFRTFHVTYGEETRQIEHLHYTAWPDYGVPLYTHSVVTYLKKLLATPRGNGPVVVHSSADVGRTGIIILCDICLHRAAAEG